MAKTKGQQSLDGMIQAERNFAGYALAHNVKQAFLQFMDSTAIEVENGKLVSGLQLWTKRQQNATLLKWHPQYAEIAFSNNLGYSTGPWTFQQSTEDSVTGRGQFTTVWHLNKMGQWKFLVDMGVTYKFVNNADTVQKINSDKTPSATLQSMLSAEDEFTRLASTNAATAHRTYLFTQSLINRVGVLPATAHPDQATLINNLPKEITYTRLGEGLAGSGDLGYVYGSVTGKAKNAAYLHIWRHEKSGWRLALKVLQVYVIKCCGTLKRTLSLNFLNLRNLVTIQAR